MCDPEVRRESGDEEMLRLGGEREHTYTLETSFGHVKGQGGEDVEPGYVVVAQFHPVQRKTTHQPASTRKVKIER